MAERQLQGYRILRYCGGEYTIAFPEREKSTLAGNERRSELYRRFSLENPELRILSSVLEGEELKLTTAHDASWAATARKARILKVGERLVIPLIIALVGLFLSVLWSTR